MSNIIELKNKHDNAVAYPVTVVEAVYDKTNNTLDKVLDSKADVKDLSNVIADEVIDNPLKEEIEVLTRDTIKKDLFIDLWNKACGNYGSYNHTSGFFELNGLTDITYDEALEIYNRYTTTPNLEQQYANCNARTNIPNKLQLGHIPISRFAEFNTKIEVVNLPTGYFQSTSLVCCFYGCTALREIYLSNPGNGIKETSMFTNCKSLRVLHIKQFEGSIDLSDSPLIELESLDYIITNARTATQPKTITLHPDVYSKITDPSNTEWYALLSKAQTKDISFATV